MQAGQLVGCIDLPREGGIQGLLAEDVRAGIAHSHGACSDAVDIGFAIHIRLVIQNEVGIFAKCAVRHIDRACGFGGQRDNIRSHRHGGNVMPLHVAFQSTPVCIAQRGGKLHRPGIKAAAGHADIRAHVHDALAPHPAYAQDRDSGTARAELRRGIVGRAQMEGIGSECAVRSCNFGSDVPRDSISVFSTILDGGMVHRHIDATDAYALGMGFQRIGFLRVNSNVLSGGDVVRPAQCDAHIAVIFHAGKGGSDVQRRHTHAEDLGLVLAFVLRFYCDILYIDILCALDIAVRYINIRRAPVDDTGIADAHAGKCAYSDRGHLYLGAFVRLRLQSIDVDILARDSGFVHGHVRVVVRVDNGVRNVNGSGTGRSDTYIFCENVAGILCSYFDIVSCGEDNVADFGMDAHLPCIGRSRIVCRRSKTYAHVFGRFDIRRAKAVNLCAFDAQCALRGVHAIQMLFDLILSVRIDSRGVVVFIFGVRKLGIRDAFVDGSDGYVHAYADTAGGSPCHLAVKAALFFRFYVDIMRRRDSAASHMGADAAVNIVQSNGYPYAAYAAAAYAAGAMRRHLVRSVYIDIVGFQIAISHQSRSLAGSVVDPHIGGYPRADTSA